MAKVVTMMIMVVNIIIMMGVIGVIVNDNLSYNGSRCDDRGDWWLAKMVVVDNTSCDDNGSL